MEQATSFLPGVDVRGCRMGLWRRTVLPLCGSIRKNNWTKIHREIFQITQLHKASREDNILDLVTRYVESEFRQPTVVLKVLSHRRLMNVGHDYSPVLQGWMQVRVTIHLSASSPLLRLQTAATLIFFKYCFDFMLLLWNLWIDSTLLDQVFKFPSCLSPTPCPNPDSFNSVRLKWPDGFPIFPSLPFTLLGMPVLLFP